MKIQDMFSKDINRKIDGVVKVGQNTENTIVQELDEYVITRELKKHFTTFFNNYESSFSEGTTDIGVWISGFFGSGKSHFLKMLSYLLSNKTIQNISTVERFRSKFEDDPATFMKIDASTRGETDTILFNIDEMGSINKDETVILRIFAKVFYDYLGFYGDNLKVVELEKQLYKKHNLDAFKEAFQKHEDLPWEDCRDSIYFREDSIIKSLMEVAGMSEDSARAWFNKDESTIELSINTLVKEIKDYVNTKPNNFRLLFMIDEVGQYIGESTSLLLNLQTLVETIGMECQGKVWVICTGQEAIDEIIKARDNEFSRIQARFKTRLSLTSSSADEVIQKRILDKTSAATEELKTVYAATDSAMRNLFHFENALSDIRGFDTEMEFVKFFPFVPYQFIIMQKVFTEIRKHGNSGKHLSGGERSMLSGFQEAAQKIENKNQYAVAPFYLFYDTVHSFLESAIRGVIDRCERAANDESNEALLPEDVDMLKLLYLIRYIDDIPAKIENITILMADDIQMDKMAKKEQVKASLERLLHENYIGRIGDTYQFLTDEEQDIAREIKHTSIDTATVVKEIQRYIFDDIYEDKKKKYGVYDFDMDKIVDGTAYGATKGGLKLSILTVAIPDAEKSDAAMQLQSDGKVTIVLADTPPYFSELEQVLKIDKFVKQKTGSQVSSTVQEILARKSKEANDLKVQARASLEIAINNGAFYVSNQRVSVSGSGAKQKIDEALNQLVTFVYHKLENIDYHAKDSNEVHRVLREELTWAEGMDPNQHAQMDMLDYLEMQRQKHINISVQELYQRYESAPYGWKEVDIAFVVAQLITKQQVSIKYKGDTIHPQDARLIDILTKHSLQGGAQIIRREMVSSTQIRAAQTFLKDFFAVMDVPKDEDGLVAFIVERFEEEKAKYERLLQQFNKGIVYPNEILITKGIHVIDDLLKCKKDNKALIEYMVNKQDNLLDLQEDMEPVESFFANQAVLYKAAYQAEKSIQKELGFMSDTEEIQELLNDIRKIILLPQDPNVVYDYKQIPELNTLLPKVEELYQKQLQDKRFDVLEIIRQCLEDIHKNADFNQNTKNISNSADAYYEKQRKEITESKSMMALEAMVTPITSRRDDAVSKIETLMKAHEDKATNPKDPEVVPKPVAPKRERVKRTSKAVLFTGREIRTEKDIEEYVGTVRKKLQTLLEDTDCIKIE